MLEHVDGAAHVDAEEALDLLGLDVHEVLQADDASRVDNNVELAAAKLHGVGDELLDVLLDGHVALGEAGAHAHGLKLGDGLLALIDLTVAQVDVGAAASKLDCHLLAQAAARAGDKDGLAGEVDVHCHASPPLKWPGKPPLPRRTRANLDP